MAMVKMPVEIDQEALAAEVPETKTKKDTVNARSARSGSAWTGCARWRGCAR